MKKTLLRNAVALAVGVGTGSAFADAIDYTATAPAAIKIASETTVSAATGTAIAAPGALTFDTGFSIAQTARYVRLDLSSGTWAVANIANDIEVHTAANFAETVASGGTTLDSFVIYEVVGLGTNAATSANDVVFTPNGGVTVKDEADVNITYALYETAGDAVSQTSPLATDTGPLLTFTQANTVTAETATATPSAIDVTVSTNTGKVFANGTTVTVAGAVNIADVATVQEADGSVGDTANIEASAVLTVDGDFTWMQDLDTSNVADGTYTLGDAFLDTDNDCAAATTNGAAETLTDTNMTFNVGEYNSDVLYVCVTGNGIAAIPEQTFTANLTTVGASGYDSESTDLTLGSHAKNGSSVTKRLVLNPNGTFKNFLRLTNTTTIAGDVTFSLRNDSGTLIQNISLGSVSGQSSSSLAGNNSTSMIDVADIYAAAQAADATFDVGSGKLQVTVSGNFGGLDVQNITTATDNTSFDTF
jgi:hypothetical protein